MYQVFLVAQPAKSHSPAPACRTEDDQQRLRAILLPMLE